MRILNILQSFFTLDLCYKVSVFVPALLPGFKLCHDRVFCAHDMERLDCSHGQRESHRGGTKGQHGAGLSQGRPAVPHDFGRIPTELVK